MISVYPWSDDGGWSDEAMNHEKTIHKNLLHKQH